MVTWMSIEGHRKLVQVIPDPLQEWWDKWELRGLVLLSLVSQIILVPLGDRKKYKPNIFTRPLVWSAYLLADWVAAVAMGVISSNLGDYYNKGEQPKNVNPQLLAFWAPFFLIHLGGPDTITAYALEDNELWKRHLVGLFSQSTLTIYVIILSWKGNLLSHLTIPILIIGIVKYVERTWSLYRASIKHLRDFFIRSIHSSKKIEQREESRDRIFCVQFLSSLVPGLEPFSVREDETQLNPKKFLGSIYIFVSLFVDLVLSPWDITHDRRQFLDDVNFEESSCHPFHWLDYELKMMYDVFYTKAFANYGILGFMSRLITLTTTIVVLVSYAILNEKKEHLVVDQVITYLLLVEAMVAEIYALILVSFSTWSMQSLFVRAIFGFLTFCCLPCAICCCYCCCLYPIQYLFNHMGRFKENVEISLGQSNFFNLISNKCLKIKGNFFPVKMLEDLPTVRDCLTSNDLQHMIFQRLLDKSEEGTQSNPAGAPGYKNLLLGKNVPIFSSELEFHRTIITWHIATDLFYYSDDEPSVELDSEADPMSSIINSRKNCKEMSDYMFYLLVKQRHMLPVGAGLITLQGTIIEAMKTFERIKVDPQEDNLTETCRMLLQHDIATERDGEDSKMQGTSVLFHACEVANQLIASRDLTWKFIEELWIEIMSYASAQCRVDMHAHQLRRGTEFLSHVWLLQAHLALLDQFQITGRHGNSANAMP